MGGLALDLSLVHAQTASDYMYSPLSRFLHVLVVVLTITITSVGAFNAVPRMTMVVQRLSAAEQVWKFRYANCNQTYINNEQTIFDIE